MLVLLPASEGKTRPEGRRRPVDLGGLSWPELTAGRERALDALATASAHPRALDLLDVGASLAAEVEANTRLRTAPAAPAIEVYSGVLYEALSWSTLGAAARRTGARQIVIGSALWGALRPGDRIPAYRLSMGASLAPLGRLAELWRPLLDAPLTAAAGVGLVVDCRSATYQSAWTPSGPLAGRTVAVRVLRDQAGRRTVVSHLAKLTRGQVTRYLLERGGTSPRTPQALAAALGEAFACELRAPARLGQPWTLDVVIG